MRKILFITFFILTYQVSHSQGSLEIDSLTNNDSIVNATSKLGSRNLVISKSLADSAYIRNDFTTAIQIYEMILRTGESADIYYNLGNSYSNCWVNLNKNLYTLLTPARIVPEHPPI